MIIIFTNKHLVNTWVKKFKWNKRDFVTFISLFLTKVYVKKLDFYSPILLTFFEVLNWPWMGSGFRFCTLSFSLPYLWKSLRRLFYGGKKYRGEKEYEFLCLANPTDFTLRDSFFKSPSTVNDFYSTPNGPGNGHSHASSWHRWLFFVHSWVNPPYKSPDDLVRLWVRREKKFRSWRKRGRCWRRRLTFLLKFEILFFLLVKEDYVSF